MTITPLVVGLDLSMTSTGVCRIGRDLVTTVTREKSKGSRDDSLAARRARLRELADRVVAHAVGADLVAVEGPSFASSGAGTHDRSGLWWLIVDGLHAHDLPVLEVPPASRMIYATGKGNAGKDEVLAAVIRRYWGVTVAGNDEADALAIAAAAARLYGSPIEDSLPQTHLRALAKLTLPAGLTPLTAAAA